MTNPKQDLPMLYKKTSTGAIQFWEIWVEGSSIITRYGQVGTDSPQTTTDTITKGKNAGKANATTSSQQAELEAEAKWRKQLKKGYVQSEADAQNDVLDEVIEGGILPMLAHKYTEHGHKMKFPCLGQPKLDGIRCTAIKAFGKVTLWTRTRKHIKSMPHIEAAILKAFPDEAVVLDGELYNHDYKDDFEHIIELVRPDEPVEGHEVVQYHIYDTPMEGPFSARNAWMEEHIKGDTLVRVHTFEINSAEDVDAWHDRMVELGYEGLILRNAAGLYVNKRSYDLLKYKHFDTEEFRIVGIEEGRGRLQGHVGKFVCLTAEGLEFRAKQRGSLKKLKEYWEDHSLWEGKILTVQFQNWTQEHRPRFPVGITIRDYE